MGLRFDLPTSAVVGHLLAPDREPPRLGYGEIEYFLRALLRRHDRFISSSRYFADDLRNRAAECLDRLDTGHDVSGAGSDALTAGTVRRVLEPLADVVRAYDVVVLPIGSRKDRRWLDRFAHEAALAPGHGLLVLIPTLYEPEVNARVLDPDEGVADALKRRDEWPGAIFAVRGQSSFFLPFEAAYRAVADLTTGGDLQPVLRVARDDAERGAARARATRRRLLHLSDLHIGARKPNQLRQYLRSAVARFEPLDRVVVTGDLFDQPFPEYRQQYIDFENQLRELTRAEPVVVPGNHDQRILGNRIKRLGRRREELVDLRWDRGPVHDSEAKIVFLCFDSSRTGLAARGGIGTEQFVDVATRYDTARQVASFDDCLRIAVLHHHPYPYPLDGEVPVIGFGTEGRERRLGGMLRERLLEMEDAERFLEWCAARDVSLVLHGHRHRPRLISDRIPTGDKARPSHSLLTVGCGASLGAGGGPLSFNVIDWNQKTGGWTVDFQVSANDARGFRSAVVQEVTGRGDKGGRVRRAG
ncbi:metallophosphoesterase [Streptomyces sp. NPDC051920]|uniref:metallophosphoesterase family protein n=1 Tax=Streptomyces sp. NPDC051920 TaxID=3155523 RepID=UPI003422E7B1